MMSRYLYFLAIVNKNKIYVQVFPLSKSKAKKIMLLNIT